MKSLELAGIITAIIGNADAGSDSYVRPDSGAISTAEIVIDTEIKSFLHVLCTRTPHAALVEAWINHAYIPASVIDSGSGYRDHTSGGGYGINVHPGSRILVEVYRTGFRLSAVIVRPQ